MRKWCFALAVVSAVSASGQAQAQQWFDGLYVGLNAGVGWGDHDRETLPIPGFQNSYSSDGALLGAHIGYSKQFSFGGGLGYVLGLEADMALTAIRGDDLGVGGTIDMSQFESLWSVRVRAGVVPIPALLLFGTIGVGGADIEHTNFGDPGLGLTGQPFHRNVDGLTWGLGAQWAFNNIWSVRVEWRHYDFGSYSVNNPIAPLLPFKVDNDLDTFTVGVSVCITGC